MIPDDLRYTAEHEWVRVTDAGRVRVGITDYAQDALGDVVYVNLPDVGAPVTAAQPFGEVESTKSVSEVYAPVGGEVAARNDELEARPDLVNQDPYGEGWLVEITIGDETQLGELLDAEAYGKLVAAAAE